MKCCSILIDQLENSSLTVEELFIEIVHDLNVVNSFFLVLVCSDFILNTLLTVTSASLIIHYSLPNSWTQFVKRFGCLLENCRSPLDNKQVNAQ